MSQSSKSMGNGDENTSANVLEKIPPDTKLQRPPISQLIFFIDERTGWAPCNRGYLCHTLDSGKSWQKLSDTKLSHVKGLYFIDTKNGYAILDNWDSKRRSNSVAKTIDGGISWKEILEVDSPIYSISFLNDRHGVVSARWSPLYITEDGGSTWKEQIKGSVDPGFKTTVGETIHRVAMVGKNKLLGYGGGFWQSSDGGKTWSISVSPKDVEIHISSESFISSNKGYFVGYETQFWKFEENRFERLRLPTELLGKDNADSFFFRVSFLETGEGWVFSQSSPVTGDDRKFRIIFTKNGGDSWELKSELDIDVLDMRFVSPTRGFIVDSANRDLFRTEDGGENWVLQIASE